MAETLNKISRMKKPRSPCFLCCSGVSRKEKFSGKISSTAKVVESGNSSKKETIGLFSWSIFRMKINYSAKTVPLDPSDKSTDLSKSKIRSSKSSSNSKSKWKIQKLFTKRTNSTTKATSFSKAPIIVTEIIEEITQGSEQDSILENRKSLDHADISKDATCRKRVSFCRKIDTIRIGSGQPASPAVVIRPNPKPTRTGKSAASSHSVSKPVSAHEKRPNPLSKSRVGTKKTRRDGNVRVNKFDPVVGISIIVVTLVIMLIWGRLCAILCTSAWLYFTPRLRTLKNGGGDDVMKINGDLDLNSKEHKNRVVLKGFLDRDHSAVAAALLL